MEPTATDWSTAHTTHGVHDFTFHASSAFVQARTTDWRQRQEEMLHGRLIKHNAFFASHQQPTLYLVHGTSNMEAILASHSLYASAGCLVGAVYCSQAFLEGDRFRLHNLGDYVFNHEVPSILKLHGLRRQPSLLLLELQLPPHTNPLHAGIDYLRMGQIHYQLYRSLQYLLNPEERLQIESDITLAVHKTVDFLAYSNHLFLTESNLTLAQAADYLTRLNAAAADLYMLGYLYFEAVSEYLMLTSDDKVSRQLAAQGEFNNWLYKELMYSLYAHLQGNFDIRCFNPTPAMLRDYIAAMNRQGKLALSADSLLQYVAERVLYWVNTRFLSHPGTAVDWLGGTAQFTDLAGHLAPLIGHSIHRQLRAQKRYREFYFYFDHVKALGVWNYWNKANIAIPFNGVFPKGELGINPAYTGMQYKVYRAQPVPGRPQYVTKGDELPIQLAPRLVDLDKSFMRAGGHYAVSRQDATDHA